MAEVHVARMDAPDHLWTVKCPGSVEPQDKVKADRMHRKMNDYLEQEALKKWDPDVVQVGDLIAVKVQP